VSDGPRSAPACVVIILIPSCRYWRTRLVDGRGSVAGGRGAPHLSAQARSHPGGNLVEMSARVRKMLFQHSLIMLRSRARTPDAALIA